MSKNSLMKIAGHFESKLGLKSVEIKRTADVKLPKNLKKLAKAERKLRTKMAEHQEKFSKLSGGPSVQYSGGSLPAVYHVCEGCQGLGKQAVNHGNTNIKLAGLNYTQIEKCSDCNGKRVVKTVDNMQCSKEQLLAYAAEKEEKNEIKKDKKAEKAKKKLEKAERKAEEKKLALEDPEKYAAVKAEKKDKKSKKKALKKANKASKKLEKLKNKFPNFVKSKEKEEVEK